MLMYCPDGLAAYQKLDHRSSNHVVAARKSQTYSVGGNNAELRHSLKRLARRAWCFLQKADHLKLWARLLMHGELRFFRAYCLQAVV